MNLVYSWGSNSKGELGVEDTEERRSPVQVNVDFNPMNIACGN